MSFDWKVFDALLTQKAPTMLAGLRPSASAENIDAAEAAIGHALPNELKAAFAAHDGQDDNWTAYYALFGRWRWHSLSGMVNAYRRKLRALEEALDSCEERALFVQAEDAMPPDQAVRTDLWNASWIPFGWDNAGTSLLIDLAPAPAGRMGQVVAWDSVDRARPKPLAQNLGLLLQSLATAVSQGSVICALNDEYPGWTLTESGQALDRFPCAI